MRQTRSYVDYLLRARAEHNGMFEETALASKFIRYYQSQKRIKVRFVSGEVRTGTVGVTTGWRPCFLLMRTSRSMGSMWTLSATDDVIAVQSGRKYISTDETES